MKKAIDFIVRHIHIISEINQLYHEIAAKIKISDSALDLIYTVCVVGECTQSDICNFTAMSRQTVNSSVRRLESEGLITLVPRDGKSMLIRLTDKGAEFAKKNVNPIIEMENDIFNTWTREEKDEYLRLTKIYRDMLKEKVQEFKEGR